MKPSLRTTNSTRHSLEEELRRLRTLAEKVEEALASIRPQALREKARRRQADKKWLDTLRAQYTKEVCNRTLRANKLFPIAER
ncbi:MAG: hypothetical protein C5B50_10955 [Verrucomicrobia bacterium]|nr:MAG: hypothetical protein C5B50_10955 [Verrucomicrobiota bacterium]